MNWWIFVPHDGSKVRSIIEFTDWGDCRRRLCLFSFPLRCCWHDIATFFCLNALSFPALQNLREHKLEGISAIASFYVQYCKQGAILLALKCTLQIVCSFTLLLVFSSVPSLKTTACKMEFHPKIISRVKTCFLLSSRIFLLKVNFTFILKTAWVEKVELARKLSFFSSTPPWSTDYLHYIHEQCW